MPGVYELGQLVLAWLAALDPRVTIHDGEVPDQPAGAYAVLYSDTGAVRSTRMAGRANRLRSGFALVVAGFSPDQVRNSVDLIRDHLEGWRPWPGDRGSSALFEVEDSAGPMIRDDSDPEDVRFSQTLFYRVQTTRS